MEIEEIKNFAINNEITLLEAIEFHKLLYLIELSKLGTINSKLEDITEAIYGLHTV